MSTEDEIESAAERTEVNGRVDSTSGLDAFRRSDDDMTWGGPSDDELRSRKHTELINNAPAAQLDGEKAAETWLLKLVATFTQWDKPCTFNSLVEAAEQVGLGNADMIRRAGQTLGVHTKQIDGQEVWYTPKSEQQVSSGQQYLKSKASEQNGNGGKVILAPLHGENANGNNVADAVREILADKIAAHKTGANGSGQSHCGESHDVAARWHRRAEELADWTERRVVNRRDISGGYYLSSDGKVNVTTSHDALTRARIIRHYRATTIGDVLGLHTTARIIYDPGIESCLSFWGAVDIDQHGDADFSQANEAAAIAWYDVLVSLGFRPLLTDSNGRGGFHLRVLFEDPTVTAHVRQLFRWLVRDWQERGLEQAPEVFPKQPEITAAGNGSCGNWLRLPGRHPKRDHWSKVGDGSEWLEGDDAIDFIVNLTGDPAQLIPNEALSFQPEGVRQTSTRSSEPKTADDVQFAREALEHLGPGAKAKNGQSHLEDYASWLMIGMALYELGDVGLGLWEEWSRQSPKYEPSGPNSCVEKWATFSASSDHGVSLGSLFHYAKEHGFKFPDPPELVWPAQSGVNEAADDPHRLARLHLAKFLNGDLTTLRCYRGEWLGWSSGAYRSISESELQAGFTGTIKGEFDRLNQLAVELWEKERGKG